MKRSYFTSVFQTPSEKLNLSIVWLCPASTRHHKKSKEVKLFGPANQRTPFPSEKKSALYVKCIPFLVPVVFSYMFTGNLIVITGPYDQM
jgi:hypothetical protein